MTIAYACVLMCMCVKFWDKILLRGENVKPRKNSIFLKKSKMVIASIVPIENLEFF